MTNRSFHKPLQEAGLVPPNCRLMDLRIAVDGAIVIIYECFLSEDQIATLGRILERVAMEAKSVPPEPNEA